VILCEIDHLLNIYQQTARLNRAVRIIFFFC
jgi:hypothetical protein